MDLQSVKIRVEARSDRGPVRDRNEDMAVVGDSLLRDAGLRCEAACPLLLAVADGVGGCDGGDVASGLVVSELVAFFRRSPAPDAADLSAWAAATNDFIRARGLRLGTPEMSTTLCGIYLRPDGGALLFNAGDSRAYRLRDGILRPLTTDHSMRVLTRNPDYPSGIIYNCFGLERDFFMDVAEIGSSLLPGDTLLVCTDGLTDALPDDALEELLPLGADALMAEAMRAEASDNITFVIAHIP